MKATIFVRSYWKDFPWLHYCLRSIRKFARGFDVKVVVPGEKVELLSNLTEDLCVYNGSGMMRAMLAALDADCICPNADLIFFLDCDCIFTKPVTPQDYLVGNKIVLPVASYVALRASPDAGDRERAELWPATMKAALGFEPSISAMCRMPVVHHRSVFERTRCEIQSATGKTAKEYLLSLPDEFPWKFSEFEALGLIAYSTRLCEDFYYPVDASIDPPTRGHAGGRFGAQFRNVNCYWSHGGITQQIKAEMESILA